MQISSKNNSQDVFSEEILKSFLPEKYENINIIMLKTVDSTNLLAKELAVNSAPHQSIIIAEEQTNGRGRLGRSFFSPPQKGLYMSLILRQQDEENDSQLVTIIAAVAVCRAIESLTNSKPMIKWVNDIFLEGKKICGILAESSPKTGAIILGIGVNIKTEEADFPAEIQKVAGSLFAENVSRCELAGKIAEEVFNIYADLSNKNLSNKDLIKNLIKEYKSKSIVLGKEIEYTQNGKIHAGKVLDINQNGNLIIATEGTTLALHSGEISIGSGRK